jgi:hypothetical protein
MIRHHHPQLSTHNLHSAMLRARQFSLFELNSALNVALNYREQKDALTSAAS